MADSSKAPSEPRRFVGFGEIASFIKEMAQLLRGTYKQADYGKVVLPFMVLRRMDCVLADTRDAVWRKAESLSSSGIKDPEEILNRVTKVPFYNLSKFDFAKLRDDPNNLARNLDKYIRGFSANGRDIIERLKFAEQIDKLEESNLLYRVVSKFAEVDLHPDRVLNHVMGSIFEELIRKYAEDSNETAGEHFTPRDVIRLMVDLVFVEDDQMLRRKGIVKTLYDPACGTGGMLSVAEEYLRELNPAADLLVFGQELNDESYAICKADMMMKGQNPSAIARGDSFTGDGHHGEKFDYMLSNPPFGVEWKKVQQEIEAEHETRGYAGRFGPGLPRVTDGSLLFLLHMISKMKPVDGRTGIGGSRIAVVFNSSPLFTGEAESGESKIRGWIIRNDWLEAIIALPDQLFYNTGISTYIWIVTNRKPESRKGKVQLVNGVEMFARMRKSLGSKRNELGPDHVATIARLYRDFESGENARVFDNDDFGYRRIVVERPLRLNFQASPERIERLHEETAFRNLTASKKKQQPSIRELEAGRKTQDDILAALGTLDAAKVWTNRDAFDRAVHAALAKTGVVVPAPVAQAILSALSERDETADVCTDAKGKREADPGLRGIENVPLKEDIHAYFRREVLPYVPDAWIDLPKSKAVGYEIPFTQHFYKYKPRRPLGEIEAEIRSLESEIQRMLHEVLE